MRYLKKFNENGFFQEIDSSEYRLLVDGPINNFTDIQKHLDDNWKPFTKKEILNIKSLLNRNFKSSLHHLALFEISDGNFYFCIVKLSDEWFILNFSITSVSSGGTNRVDYKCDQFDGLIECLKYLKNKKIHNLFE